MTNNNTNTAVKFYTENGYTVAAEQAVKILEQAAKVITLSQLKRLCGRGDMQALDLISGRQPETMKDCMSETKLYLLEQMVEGNVFFNDLIVSDSITADNRAEAMRLLFADDAVKLAAFRTVRNYLYQQGKHERKNGGDLDGDEAMQIADSSVCVEFGAVEADFRSSLNDLQAKVFDLMVEGYKQAEICDRLGLSNGTASRLILKVKSALLEYVKA